LLQKGGGVKREAGERTTAKCFIAISKTSRTEAINAV